MEAQSPYRGQWGGKIANGEEMWWSEPNGALGLSAWRRFWFRMDVRQHFVLRIWDRALARHGRGLEALDFGCGAGGTTLNFSRLLGVPLTGMDIFETQLGIAREFARREGSSCRFERLAEDGRIPRPDASIDAIMSLDVLGHVPDIPAVLREWARTLKPGGSVILFTESTYSAGDRSIMRRLADDGLDMMEMVPEHISLFPREALERMFADAGFSVRERFSANLGHFFFFPKDYVLLLRGRAGHRATYALAWAWNRLSKLAPFYPRPFELLRLLLTRAFGRRAYGTSYFYELAKK
jgi:ubiquinone/menaquinone biosynthesis C-methylase UbiE